jgi:predicted lipoprotein with Yx(FWY)xxD motif
MRRLRLAVPAAALFAAAGVGAAYAATLSSGGTVKTEHATIGTLLASSSGFTLYHYTDDKKGSIECTGACAKLWPPLTIKAGTKPKAGAGIAQAKLSTVKRPDGKTQVVYNGFTLYRYAGDAKPGSVKGQGIEGEWFAVTAKGALAKGSASTGGSNNSAPPPSGTTTMYDPGYPGGGY